MTSWKVTIGRSVGVCAVLGGVLLLPACSTPVKPPPASIAAVPTNRPTVTVSRAPQGPTLHLPRTERDTPTIPISEFMYFVPLISPDPLVRTENPGNTQQARLLTAKRRVSADSFSLTCEFEISGAGFERNTFDPTNHLRRHEKRLQEGGVLERQLDYIVLDGPGRGRIEVQGTVSNGLPVVAEVRLRFNDQGRSSPVTIGLHDIRMVGEQVRFENEVIARVNALTFRRAAGPAKMDVSLASLKHQDAGDGLWQKFIGSMAGTAANLFLKPITVDRKGHDAMLNFGLALAAGESSFTFPLARNLKVDQ